MMRWMKQTMWWALAALTMSGSKVSATPFGRWVLDSRYTPPPQDQINVLGKGTEEEHQKNRGFFEGVALLADQRPESRYDAPIIQELIEKNPFGFTVPGLYRPLITSNKKNYYFPTEANRQKRDVVCIYSSPDMTMTVRPRVKWSACIYLHNIWPYDMLAVFEPKPDMKPLITLPETATAGLSEEDKAYTTQLLSVVNENLSYIGEIPFYKPDLNLFWCYADFIGQVIPEKYLLTGAQLDKVPEKLIDQNKIDLQKRLGYPVYNVCDLEVGREWKSYAYTDLMNHGRAIRGELAKTPKGTLKDNGGSPIASCSGMKVVPTLYYIQGSSNFEKRAAIVADALRKIQYRRAQKSLKTFFLGLKAEKELQKDHPARVQVLNQILVQAVKYGQTWNNMLQKAIDEKKFLFSLTDPNGQMDSIDKVDYYHPRTTWGYYSKEGLKPIIVKDIEEQKKLMLLWKQRVRD